MKRLTWCLVLLIVPYGEAWGEDPQPSQAQPAAVDETVSEARKDAKEVPENPAAKEADAAIRKNVEDYVATFGRGDAKALAAFWTEEGEFTTPGGNTLRGREQLAADFAAYFKDSPGSKLELWDVQVTLLSPRVASETGKARVVTAEELPSETVYEAIHVKTPEGWKIDSLREQSLESSSRSNYERLQALEWMIGTWVDEDEDSIVETTGRWATNENFIVRTFRVFLREELDFEGTQVIGWDPSLKAVRSWTFDSDGGFGVGRWSGEGNRWTVQALNILPDGRRGSSTNTYEIVDENTMQFRSIGRQVDGELLPSIGPVSVVRAP